jgi:hypothetical protein
MMSTGEEVLLTETDRFKCKVSSTLNKSAEYASRHMFDGTDITCWNSDQGSPQYIFLDLCRVVKPTKLVFQFQGGFVCENCIIEAGLEMKDLTDIIDPVHPDNSNSVQEFALTCEGSSAAIKPCRYFKVIFPESLDFFGRVTIYQLQLYGVVIS